MFTQRHIQLRVSDAEYHCRHIQPPRVNVHKIWPISYDKRGCAREWDSQNAQAQSTNLLQRKGAMADKKELYKQGNQLQQERKFEEAIQKYDESYALDEKFTVALHAKVQCLTELGRHDEAIALAKRLVELEPDDQFSHIALSRAYQRAGFIPEAEHAMMMGQQAQMRSQASGS